VALIEAMACGLPPVAADASGVREILGATLVDAVVPRGDADALPRGLLSLLDDLPRARRLGESARRRAVAACGLDAVGGQLRRLLIRRQEA